MASVAEHSDEIDEARAAEARKRAEAELEQARDPVDLARVRAALQTALMRERIATGGGRGDSRDASPLAFARPGNLRTTNHLDRPFGVRFLPARANSTLSPAPSCPLVTGAGKSNRSLARGGWGSICAWKTTDR